MRARIWDELSGQAEIIRTEGMRHRQRQTGVCEPVWGVASHSSEQAGWVSPPYWAHSPARWVSCLFCYRHQPPANRHTIRMEIWEPDTNMASLAWTPSTQSANLLPSLSLSPTYLRLMRGLISLIIGPSLTRSVLRNTVNIITNHATLTSLLSLSVCKTYQEIL